MYRLSIITPEKVIFEDTIHALIAPGADGYLEILNHHVPIIVALQTGKLTIITQHHKKLLYAVSEGFLEFKDNQASILSQTVEPASEIDITRVKNTLEKSQKRLANLEASTPDQTLEIAAAKASIKKAQNRMHVYQDYQNQLKSVNDRL